MFITLLLLFTVPQRSATIASHFTFCEYCLELEKIAIILIAARRYASAVYAMALCLCLSAKSSTKMAKRVELCTEASFCICPTLYLKEIWISSKIRVLPSGTFPQTLNSEYFAGKSIALSTKLVEGRACRRVVAGRKHIVY